MKKRARHIKHLRIVHHDYTSRKNNDPNTLIEVYDVRGEEKYGQFYVPTKIFEDKSVLRLQVIKSRIKHDFNITYDHSTGMMQ